MKFVQKFMQTERSKCHFQQLDAEPRPASNTSSVFPGGPPPSYRSSTNADDSSTFSSTESSSVAATATSIKRRNSWANLIESDENLYRNHFPHFAQPFCTAAATSTATTIANGGANVSLSDYYLPATEIYGNNNQSFEKYNLSGRYAKHFTPIYLLNSVGDPIAVSKLDLTKFGSLCKLNDGGTLKSNRSEHDRMSEVREWCREPKNKFCSFVLLLLTITCCMFVAILFSHNQFTESRKFTWIPPAAFRNQQRNPTVVRMSENGEQVRFEILGNLPIKNDYIAVHDFRTRKIAIIDSTLKNNGKNLVCFVMNMNMSTMPDKYAIEIGAQNSFMRKEQTQGWEEIWNFVPGSYFGDTSVLFNPPISECNGARWILLNYTKADQRGQKCSDCYDFCLPELGLEKDRLRAETFLNIVRRNCFYLFVPEWRSFAAAYSSEQNQRDFEQFYHEGQIRDDIGNNGNKNVNGNGGSGFNAIQTAASGIVHPITDQYRNFESKWISVQQIPQQFSNLTSQTANQMGNIPSNVPSSLSDTAKSIFGSGNYQQRPAGIGGDVFTGNMPTSTDNNFNFNGNNNDQTRDDLGREKSGLPSSSKIKPLLPMPPPSYPVQTKQQSQSPLDRGNSYPGGSPHAGFASNDGGGQFILTNNYGGQSGYNLQLPSGQPSSNVLPNTMHIDSESNQPKSVYDQPIMNTLSHGSSISEQSNFYTPRPIIDTTDIKRSSQNGDALHQHSMNDQGWITVG